MKLTLKETRAVTGLADVLYEFLPGSGHATWKGHENFATVATNVGLAGFWTGGSKKPAITNLLSQTLQHKKGSFEHLILEIVRTGLRYRQKQDRPISRDEIDELNGHILELGFKFPELWDPDFRASLKQTTKERAREFVDQADAQHRQQSAAEHRSQELVQLKAKFLQLAAQADRNNAGLALEQPYFP